MNDKDFQLQVCDKITELFIKNKSDVREWIINLIECYEINNCNLYEIKKMNKNDPLLLSKRPLKDGSNIEAIKKLYIYLLNEIEDDTLTYSDLYYDELALGGIFEDEASVGAKIYIVLLINLLQIFSENNEAFILNLDIYFTYQPPNLFDRISNQRGLFIYQPYMYYKDAIYNNFNILNFQVIKPDITIEINNDVGILKELDYLNINLETVYSDADNIAKAIKYKSGT